MFQAILIIITLPIHSSNVSILFAVYCIGWLKIRLINVFRISQFSNIFEILHRPHLILNLINVSHTIYLWVVYNASFIFIAITTTGICVYIPNWNRFSNIGTALLPYSTCRNNNHIASSIVASRVQSWAKRINYQKCH